MCIYDIYNIIEINKGLCISMIICMYIAICVCLCVTESVSVSVFVYVCVRVLNYSNNQLDSLAKASFVYHWQPTPSLT